MSLPLRYEDNLGVKEVLASLEICVNKLDTEKSHYIEFFEDECIESEKILAPFLTKDLNKMFFLDATLVDKIRGTQSVALTCRCDF